MKETSNSLSANLSNGQLEILTREVKETIAFKQGVAFTKAFATTDLWNIQRQRISRLQRRFF